MSGDKAICWSTVAVVAAVAAVAAVVSYRHAQQVVTHYAETGLLERCCLSRSTGLSIAPRWRCCTLPATSPACQRWHGGGSAAASPRRWPPTLPPELATAHPAQSSPHGRPPHWCSATNCCCGSCGPARASLSHPGRPAKMRRSLPTGHQSRLARRYQRTRCRHAMTSADARRAGSWPPWHTNPTALADSGPEVHHKLTGSVLPPTVVGGRTQPQAGGDDLRPPVQPRPLWLAARPHVAESNASSTTHRYAEQRIRMDGSRDLQLDLGTRTMSFRRFRPASRIIREHWPAEC
jgi:hypothetical protein